MGQEVSTHAFAWGVRGCVAAVGHALAGRRPTCVARRAPYIGFAQTRDPGPPRHCPYDPGFGRVFMNAMRVVGALLLVLGLAGFLTGGFNFTKDTTQAKIGPLELTVKEKETVNIPQWLSLGAMVLGGVVLVLGFRKS